MLLVCLIPAVYRATVSAQRGLLSFSVRVSLLFIIQLWHELPVKSDRRPLARAPSPPTVVGPSRPTAIGPQYFGTPAYSILMTECSLVLLSSPLTNSRRQPLQIVYYWPRRGVVRPSNTRRGSTPCHLNADSCAASDVDGDCQLVT